jgi:hypothetical protein
MLQVIRLGEPRKQNGGVRRARLGDFCRQAKQYPKEKGAEKEGLMRRIKHLQKEPIKDYCGTPT